MIYVSLCKLFQEEDDEESMKAYIQEKPNIGIYFMGDKNYIYIVRL